MRKYMTLICTLVLIFCSVPIAAAAPRLIIDGQPVYCDVPPYIEDECTMVPAGTVFPALGADVYWDPESDTIRVEKGMNSVIMTVGQAYALYNGEILIMDAPVELVEDRAMVPLNFAADIFNTKINWLNIDPDNQIIVMRNPIIASKIGMTHDTFRHTRWGQSMEQVVQAEGIPTLYATSQSLVYYDVYFNNILGDLGYYFLNDSLTMAFYDLHGDRLVGNEKIDQYNSISESLSSQYGNAVVNINEWSSPEAAYQTNDMATAIESGDLELFNAWFDEYSIICLFLGNEGNNLGLIYADLDQLDKSLFSLFGY